MWGGSNSAGLSDYFSDDTDGDGALGIEAGGSGKVRGDAGRCGPIRPSGDGVEINGGLEGRMKPEAACDVILEAVPTGDMQKEMMDSVPVEVRFFRRNIRDGIPVLCTPSCSLANLVARMKCAAQGGCLFTSVYR